MKRRPPLLLVLLLLVAGAIVNVAVAWGVLVNTEHGDWTFYVNGQKHEYVFAPSDFGWPLRAMTNDYHPQQLTPRRNGWYVGKLVIPLGPIWPGFAINTVFYAVVLWLLFAAPVALRRRRRTKRGLCPKCAYPVGTNARCTECGAAHEGKP